MRARPERKPEAYINRNRHDSAGGEGVVVRGTKLHLKVISKLERIRINTFSTMYSASVVSTARRRTFFRLQLLYALTQGVPRCPIVPTGCHRAPDVHDVHSQGKDHADCRGRQASPHCIRAFEGCAAFPRSVPGCVAVGRRMDRQRVVQTCDRLSFPNLANSTNSLAWMMSRPIETHFGRRRCG